MHCLTLSEMLYSNDNFTWYILRLRLREALSKGLHNHCDKPVFTILLCSLNQCLCHIPSLLQQAITIVLVLCKVLESKIKRTYERDLRQIMFLRSDS